MGVFKTINDYIFHYRKFGKHGIKLYANINNNTKNIFEVQIRDILHPFYLRGSSSDIAVFYQVFSLKQYKINYCFKPCYIFDLGANIGLASIYLKNIYPNATIIAVEPDPSNFELLLKNTAPYKNIYCYNGGIWNKTTKLEIIDIGKGEWAFVTKEVSPESANTIQAITIDDLVQQFNVPTIDILKLDVEGAEKEIFEGQHEKVDAKSKSNDSRVARQVQARMFQSFFNAMTNYNFSTRFRGENIICDME